MGTTTNIAAAAASTTAATGNNSATSLAGNFNTFLTLMTTQLKNQDPTNPVDSNQFTQQLVAFAGVQQQVESNTYLQQLLAATQANQVGTASSFVGTTIQATGNQGALTGGATDFGYNLAAAATSAQVTITDSTGAVVFTGPGPTAAGPNVVQWNGNNTITGATEPDGIYTISVKAADSAGNTIASTPFITGTVTSASITNGQVMLNIGALQVPETNVTSVTNLAKTPVTSPTTGS
jgi:flagellar basal-body rod modification protein FlgD